MRRAWTRARGDERLSGKKGEAQIGAEPEARRRPQKPRRATRRRRKQRAGDLGRALRSIYDDTLRESVPDDFLDLLGKLS